uniref:Uncharacterized protein n=1 Tax=Macaca fascicularis TaxID=9541 RepID=A0A7N9D353_MACFA
CWRLGLVILSSVTFLQCLHIIIIKKNKSRVHVHNVQVCYICIHVPCWCAVPINSSFTLASSFILV